MLLICTVIWSLSLEDFLFFSFLGFSLLRWCHEFWWEFRKTRHGIKLNMRFNFLSEKLFWEFGKFFYFRRFWSTRFVHFWSFKAHVLSKSFDSYRKSRQFSRRIFCEPKKINKILQKNISSKIFKFLEPRHRP